MTLEDACHTYYNKIYRHCLKELYYNDEAAKDATQEAFAALCRAWNKLDQDDFEPWLWRTAGNYILKAKADYTKRNQLVSTQDDTYPDLSTEKDMYEQIICQKIDESIDQYRSEIYAELTEKEQRLANCILQKMKYADIAKELDSTPGAISMAVVRLNRKVKSIIQRIVEKIL